MPNPGTAGTAVVGLVVQSDGTVGEICDTGRSDPHLLDAVRTYLRSCKFAPSEQGTKGSITVKMILPFTFRPDWVPPSWWTPGH
jgi:hypothetical protein